MRQPAIAVVAILALITLTPAGAWSQNDDKPTQPAAAQAQAHQHDDASRSEASAPSDKEADRSQAHKSPAKGMMGGGMGMMKGGMMGMMGREKGGEKGKHGMGGGMGMMGGRGEHGGMGQGLTAFMKSQIEHSPRTMAGLSGRHGRKVLQRMAKALHHMDLSPEQWEKVRQISSQKLGAMIELQAARAKLGWELRSLRWDTKLDAKKVEDLYARKAQVEAKIFLASADYLSQIRALLTPEQQAALEATPEKDSSAKHH